MTDRVTAEEKTQEVREEPLGVISRFLYIPYPQPDAALVLSDSYVGDSPLHRMQAVTIEKTSDVYEEGKIRFSKDNGKTWDQWQQDPLRLMNIKGTVWTARYRVNSLYDPQAKRTVQMFMQRTYIDNHRTAGETYFDHTFYWISKDDGFTYGTPKLLKLTEGADFDPDQPDNPDFLKKNNAYFGYNTITLQEGGLAFAVCVNAEITNEKWEKEMVGGLYVFIGKWDKTKEDYSWNHYGPLAVTKAVSGRGLMEPAIVQLKDGRLVILARGSNAAWGSSRANVPGRCWYAISKDMGKTWCQITDLRYDDGEPFYVPSSFCKLIRHSQTKKLYWVGNISRELPDGNSPRYPLYIAELDENTVTLKYQSLSIIDDKDPKRHQHPDPQFSNFSLFENRQTNEFEIYLTGYGEYENIFQANSYRYTIKLKSNQ